MIVTYHDSEGCPGMEVNVAYYKTCAVYFQGDGHILTAVVAGPEDEHREKLVEMVNDFLPKNGRLEGPQAAAAFREKRND